MGDWVKKSIAWKCTRPSASASGHSLGQTSFLAWYILSGRSWRVRSSAVYCFANWRVTDPIPLPTSTTVVPFGRSRHGNSVDSIHLVFANVSIKIAKDDYHISQWRLPMRFPNPACWSQTSLQVWRPKMNPAENQHNVQRLYFLSTYLSAVVIKKTQWIASISIESGVVWCIWITPFLVGQNIIETSDSTEELFGTKKNSQ